MGRKITIEPVTRIEGHGRVTIHLDDQGVVEQTFFHVDEFRGLEKFCEGRPYYEMPQITQRICGICRSAITWRRPKHAMRFLVCSLRVPPSYCAS